MAAKKAPAKKVEVAPQQEVVAKEIGRASCRERV